MQELIDDLVGRMLGAYLGAEDRRESGELDIVQRFLRPDGKFDIYKCNFREAKGDWPTMFRLGIERRANISEDRGEILSRQIGIHDLATRAGCGRSIKDFPVFPDVLAKHFAHVDIDGTPFTRTQSGKSYSFSLRSYWNEYAASFSFTPNSRTGYIIDLHPEPMVTLANMLTLEKKRDPKEKELIILTKEFNNLNNWFGKLLRLNHIWQ